MCFFQRTLTKEASDGGFFCSLTLCRCLTLCVMRANKQSATVKSKFRPTVRDSWAKKWIKKHPDTTSITKSDTDWIVQFCGEEISSMNLFFNYLVDIFCTIVHFMNFKQLLEVEIVHVSKVLYVHWVLTDCSVGLLMLKGKKWNRRSVTKVTVKTFQVDSQYTPMVHVIISVNTVKWLPFINDTSDHNMYLQN